MDTTINGQGVGGAARSWNKADWKGYTEGPFGFPVAEKSAGELERISKDCPKDEHHGFARMTFVDTVKEMDTEQRTDVSVIASNAIDRDREVFNVSGIVLDGFQKNPVVTFAHRYDMLPVGKCLWIKKEGEKIKGKTRYSPKPDGWSNDWFPDAVWHLVKSGDLRGKSIGGVRRRGHPPSPEEITKRPELAGVAWIYDEIVLVEYAVATVQSNPDAVVEMVSKGVASAEVCKALGLAIPCGTDPPASSMTGVTEPPPAVPVFDEATLTAIAEKVIRSSPAMIEAEALRRMANDCVLADRFGQAMVKQWQSALDNVFSADSVNRIVQERLDHYSGRV